MKAIQTGNTFRIYDNSMKTYDQIPTQAYLVNFDPRQGFFLTMYSDININEKVYGIHETKVKKVFNAFNSFDRNLGVILSGDKGIGKSLFSKMLAATAIQSGIPLIIVNTFIPGIGEYLNDIEQEVMVLFDEFDKTFARGENGDPQASMLTLFDGIAQGKKLFVVTCNELRGLNDFLVNRPGRFHYHFRFNYPNEAEITEYLQDKLDPSYYDQIPAVISFSKKVALNYDSLRAIAFELNCGDNFATAIADLNIVHLERDRYTMVLYFSNGEQIKLRSIAIDLFDEDSVNFTIEDPDSYDTIGYVEFVPADNVYDTNIGHCIIKGKDLKWELAKYLEVSEDKDEKKLYERFKDATLQFISFHRIFDKNIHYSISV